MNNSDTLPNSIDEYIAGFPPEVQEILQQVRSTIRQAAPEAQETIKYQMPTFELHGNLVHFGASTPCPPVSRHSRMSWRRTWAARVRSGFPSTSRFRMI